jgi:decaprenylphospho-beta-D-ribofuranose 2-oxidase
VSRERISGWGRSSWSLTEISTELPVERSYIARGLGRSYGDCAALTGGVTVERQGGSNIQFVNDAEVIAGANVSLERLLSEAIKHGLFLPVSPGTRYVTIGGAIAANVHGKNHHRSGSIGNHVLEIRLALPDGEILCSPESHQDLFWATIGGMGLTGVILEVRLRLKRIESPHISRHDVRKKSLDLLLAGLRSGDDQYEYSVAWVDTLAQGKNFGRGIITFGNHETIRKRKSVSPRKPLITIPFDLPEWLLNEKSMHLFNSFWYGMHQRDSRRNHSDPWSFFYPLDSIGQWNRIYGKRGFLQYQFVVPESGIETLEKILEKLSKDRVPVFLSVLKRFGSSNQGWMSFPIEGWTLAIDIPTDFPGLSRLLDGFDDMVVSASGRVYLAKDSRLAKEPAEMMYPMIGRFRELRERLGISNLIKSDLSERLSL